MEEAFGKAANYVTFNAEDIDSDKLLILYGYYKQSTHGPCDTPKPWFYDLKNKQKWQAWNQLGSMSKNDAMKLYIETVNTIDSDWESKVQSGKIGWVSVSTMVKQENINAEDKNIFDHIKENDLNEIKSYKGDLNIKDETGMSLLHWAADRGHLDIVNYLINQKVDINCQDEGGQTPLHFAASCGHKDIISSLISAGADVHLKDSDDSLAIDWADSDSVKALFD